MEFLGHVSVLTCRVPHKPHVSCLITISKKKTVHSLRLRFLVDFFGAAGTINVFNFLVSSWDCKSRRKKQRILVIFLTFLELKTDRVIFDCDDFVWSLLITDLFDNLESGKRNYWFGKNVWKKSWICYLAHAQSTNGSWKKDQLGTFGSKAGMLEQAEKNCYQACPHWFLRELRCQRRRLEI